MILELALSLDIFFTYLSVKPTSLGICRFSRGLEKYTFIFKLVDRLCINRKNKKIKIWNPQCTISMLIRIQWSLQIYNENYDYIYLRLLVLTYLHIKTEIRTKICMFRHYNKLSTETTLRLTMQSSLFYIEMGHILSTYCS